MVGANHRVLICCTCHFQSGSLCLGSSVCWSLQCLISVQTQGGNGGHFFRLTCSLLLWGGGTLQTNITGVCSQWFSHTGFDPTHGVCAVPVYTTQALGCCVGNCLMLALGCMYSPGLNRSDSGSQGLHKGSDLVGPVFCARPRSEQHRWTASWWA